MKTNIEDEDSIFWVSNNVTVLNSNQINNVGKLSYYDITLRVINEVSYLK